MDYQRRISDATYKMALTIGYLKALFEECDEVIKIISELERLGLNREFSKMAQKVVVLKKIQSNEKVVNAVRELEKLLLQFVGKDSIYWLGLDENIVCALHRNHADTVQDLSKMSQKEISQIDQIGPIRLGKIVWALKKIGIEVK